MKYASDYMPRKYIDPISREYIYDHGWSYDDFTGEIKLTKQQFAKAQYTDRSLREPEKRTIQIPTIHGSCLLIEGKHFTIV